MPTWQRQRQVHHVVRHRDRALHPNPSIHAHPFFFPPLARTRFSVAAHGGPPAISLFLSLVKNPALHHLRCSDGVYEKQTTYKVQNASLWSSKIAEAAQGKMGEVTYKASNPRSSRQSICKHSHTPAHTLQTQTHATLPLSKDR